MNLWAMVSNLNIFINVSAVSHSKSLYDLIELAVST